MTFNNIRPKGPKKGFLRLYVTTAIKKAIMLKFVPNLTKTILKKLVVVLITSALMIGAGKGVVL